MQSAVRPYVTAGVVLLGASVVAVTPVALPPNMEQGLERISHAAVGLVDDVLPADVTLTDLENIPYNLFAEIANIPYEEFAQPITTPADIAYTTDTPGVGATPIPDTSLGDVGLFDNVLAYDGNWWIIDAVNVLGTDPGDPPKIAAFFDLLFGNPDIGNSFASLIIPIEEADLPLEAGCPAIAAGGCPDPQELLTGYTESNGTVVPGYFQAPLEQFFSSTGYTFPGTANAPWFNEIPSGETIPPGIPPDTTFNPIPLGPGEYYAALPWSGTTVSLNPEAPLDAEFNYLIQDPADNPIQFPTVTDVETDINGYFTGLNTDFNPFVPGSTCAICDPSTLVSTSETNIGSLVSTSVADLTALFDDSGLSTELTQLIDAGALSSDLSGLPSELSALLASL
jgi:hypothetical protein